MGKANTTTNTTVKTPPKIAELTTREQEVLKLIVKGYSNREIAE
ncbi:MAG: LuxR C-terminal-related transcriptional regulator [Xenococcaceae cyanobacterium MO_234.B1]|nr:LuxR C-terminal-related transcriptional regulator [Xenococcaceae cyanobacterium MO_234.B1]